MIPRFIDYVGQRNVVQKISEGGIAIQCLFAIKKFGINRAIKNSLVAIEWNSGVKLVLWIEKILLFFCKKTRGQFL